jgi:regulator of sigma E protease
MVTIHELGHYTAGKLLKFKINEFAVGFGKVLWSKVNKAGEKISLRLFPLGGYCAFEDEEGKDGKENPDSFIKQKPWKRLVVLFMGPFFNLISAVFFSFIFLLAYGYADRVQVTKVDADFRVAAGIVQETDWFMEGDVILAVNGERTNFVYDKYFSNLAVSFDEGETYEVLVKRDGQELTLVVSNAYKPIQSRVETESNSRFYAINGRDYIYRIYAGADGKLVLTNTKNTDVNYTSDENGIWLIGDVKIKATLTHDSITSEDYYSLGLLWGGIEHDFYKYGFFEAIGQSFVFAFGWAWKVLVILWGLITGGIALSGVGGPITTITTIASATQMNFANFFLLLPLISANLAVFNLLPFPALDGARMVFVALEGIFRKPVVSRNVEAYIHFGGLIVLFAFVIIIDIIHFLV